MTKRSIVTSNYQRKFQKSCQQLESGNPNALQDALSITLTSLIRGLLTQLTCNGYNVFADAATKTCKLARVEQERVNSILRTYKTMLWIK